MRISLTPCVAALVFVSALAQLGRAQSPLSTLGTNIKNSAGDAWDVWTSPARGQPDDWLVAFGVVAGSAGLSLADPIVDRWAVKQTNNATWWFLKPFREGGIAFSGQFITPVALGALAVSVVERNYRLQEALLGCGAAYAASSAVRTYVIYPVLARTRPDSSHDIRTPPATFGDQYEVNIPGARSWGRHSFPGGHVANVAACAEFLTSRYSMGAAQAIPWALVGGVSVARLLDRRHWLSDQVVGIAFGYAVGKQFAVRSSRRVHSETAPVVAATPDGLNLSRDDRGFRMTWKLAF
ncbi:MAG TPA: phosphatase PAP2 family protein [Gemmatimonadaceae bacterium]